MAVEIVEVNRPAREEKVAVSVQNLLRLQVAHCPACGCYWAQEASPPAAPLCPCGWNCTARAAEFYAQSVDAALSAYKLAEAAGEFWWQKEKVSA